MFYKHSPLPISLIYTKLLIYSNFIITNVAFGAILMWHLARFRCGVWQQKIRNSRAIYMEKEKALLDRGGASNALVFFAVTAATYTPGD